MSTLETVEAIHVATVLEDCVDQLAILGQIMPVSYEERPDADELVNDEITQLVDGQLQLESRYEQVLGKQKDLRGTSHSLFARQTIAKTETQNVGRDLRNSTHVLSRSLKQNPLTPDNLEKVQADRAYLQRVLYGTLLELSQAGGFQTLVDAVKMEKEKKARLQETIQKEKEGQKRMKALNRQLVEVKKEKEVEVQERNEMIAHLKDQLQELKAKTNMEGKYIKKCAEVSVSQTQKKCTMSERELQDEIENLQLQIEEENRVSTEIEQYLKTHQVELEHKVAHWMEKFDKDVDAKQHELEVLKASKAKDLERLQELTKLYAEYEQVVVEDRIDREKLRRKQEQELEELKSAVMIQAWFRGLMVRRGLGAFGKKKKKGKKGKKGKKSGKKKKK